MTATAIGYRFGGISVLPQTANPYDDTGGADVVTADMDAGAPDAGVPAPADAGPSDGGAPPGGGVPMNQCTINTGPTYTPSGTIPVSNSGGRKSATFNLAASFVSGGSNIPSCCSVRQFIKWDQAFHDWRGGPPHSGFPSGSPPNTWIEDRNAGDTFRYGYRTGTWAVPVAGCGNEYKTGNTQDMANGDTYCGRDTPGGPSSMTGQFKFRLDVVDTCNGGTKASTPEITINW